MSQIIGPGVFIVMGTVWCVIFGVYIYQLRQAAKWGRQSKHWPKTMGKIINAGLVKPKPNQSGYYRLKIEYEYVVNDQCFVGKRVSFGELGTTQHNAEEMIKEYWVGRKIKVYYHPENPKLATLQTDFPEAASFFGWIPAVMIPCITLPLLALGIKGLLQAIGWIR
jgi:hypothetical protein